MIEKKIFIDYKENGIPTNAENVTLSSFDNVFGVKSADGDIIVSSETNVFNPSIGRYEYTLNIENNKIYIASWRVQSQPGGSYRYVIQEFGPFGENPLHNSSAESRGNFVQGSVGTLFLKTFNIDGVAENATNISVTIYDENWDIVASGFPDIISTGYYVFDLDIPEQNLSTTIPAGTYYVNWNYDFNGQSNTETQEIIIYSPQELSASSLYDPRIVLMRESLSYMIGSAQKIPVYRDLAKPSKDFKTFQFSFPRWNHISGIRVYVNDDIQNDSYKVNFNDGTITFDNSLTKYDTVSIDYNFRWFSDQEIDRFLSNSIAMFNLYPATTRYTLYGIPEMYLPLIFYGAAVDAIRSMLLSLSFQETQLVYGGPAAAKDAYSQLEALKKNYEETWNKGLEQKKYGPYKGLTKMVVTPEFTLPGGRSRWFRMLFT